ncbi:PREDICTED: glutaredoxin-C3-like [Ceratosolen solmsi marchali]|uniref:Glutaredoxin-2, mitochondrial n=1 Tax=Ceratosolen solmsi marchali TaxID=326594 RepID=A0AAJ7E0A8_9HYME|nr:PREDICTED: glutaredoxin-C3-like [Ceratosolen solmsi marchali]
MFQGLCLFFQKQLQIIWQSSINSIKISIEDENEKYQHNLENSDESASSTTAFKMPITREEVNKLIISDKVVIFSKSNCPYCRMAKEVFDAIKQNYTAIELDKRNDTDDFQNILEDITGARSVPRVFVNGQFLGGGTDIKKLYQSGELVKKL